MQQRHRPFAFGIEGGSFPTIPRHTIREGRYTDDAGQKWRTGFRERLDVLSFEFGYPLWGGRLRPGAALDFGIFRFSRRDGKDDAPGDWHTFHDDKGGLLSSGRRSLTTGATLFLDIAPIGKYGGGLTLRPYWQVPMIQPSMFGRYGTFDSGSYQYRITNFGLSASWAFTLSHPKS